MQYRSEIDGLRAIAVLPVILFHAGFGLFSGGFIGVDVFFVISGFLITSIIQDELAKEKFSILHFYERRARRILPALFFVTVCCFPFAWFWMTPGEFNDFTRSVISVCLFVSNIFFYAETDYFAFSAEQVPLLHTWSLAVEEQYYLIFPVFLLLVWRYGRFLLLPSILLIAIGSLALAQYASTHWPVANFYLTPTRLWELMAGSACAIVVHRINPKGNDGLALLGLLLILYAVFGFDGATPFPSIYTVIPVLGTVLIVLFARGKTLVARLLSTRILVGIGLISFSAYLWHQPLFAFARIRTGASVDQILFAGLIVANFLLAYLSWRFIEQPFRFKKKPLLPSQTIVFAAAGVSTFALMGAAFVLDNQAFYMNGKTDQERYFLSFHDYGQLPDSSEGRVPEECTLSTRRNSLELFDAANCLTMNQDKPNYLLLGDSHAGHIWKALSEAYPEVNIMAANASGCRPVMSYEGQKRCTDLVRYIFEDFLPTASLDGIILSSRWDEASADKIEPTVQYLSGHTNNVVVIGPTIEYYHDLPLILGARNFDQTTDFDKLAAHYINQDMFNISGMFQEKLGGSPAQYISVIDALCLDGICRTLSDEGKPMAFDYGHLTLSGSRTFVNHLRNEQKLLLGD